MGGATGESVGVGVGTRGGCGGGGVRATLRASSCRCRLCVRGRAALVHGQAEPPQRGAAQGEEAKKKGGGWASGRTEAKGPLCGMSATGAADEAKGQPGLVFAHMHRLVVRMREGEDGKPLRKKEGGGLCQAPAALAPRPPAPHSPSAQLLPSHPLYPRLQRSTLHSTASLLCLNRCRRSL